MTQGRNINSEVIAWHQLGLDSHGIVSHHQNKPYLALALAALEAGLPLPSILSGFIIRFPLDLSLDGYDRATKRGSGGEREGEWG
jgi:hypothetical protein